MNPAATVVIVSDYRVGTAASWDELRSTLRGLAAQDFDEPVEHIYLENAAVLERIPTDLSAMLPRLRVVASKSELQYALKNEAASQGQSDIVVLLDADCVPTPAWLRHMVAAMRSEARPSVVSGRTLYEGHTLFERCCALLERAYVDRKRFGPTKHISNNNAAFRRPVLAGYPLPLNAGPFASRTHAERIRRGGGRLYSEPQAHVVHAFHGWTMQKDVRRHKGYSRIATRRLDPELPFSKLVRLGPLCVPLFLCGSLLQSLWWGIRFRRDYGIRWYEMPALAACAIVLHALELPGMTSAIRGRRLGATEYR
jgi:hypothetical protein